MFCLTPLLFFIQAAYSLCPFFYEYLITEWQRNERRTMKKKVNVYLSSLMMKVPDHVYVLG
jgi:hypothetical protein